MLLSENCIGKGSTAVMAYPMVSRVTGGDWRRRGFRGGPFGVVAEPSQINGKDDADEGNLAATYSALATLVALDFDLTTGVDSDAIVRALGSLQQEDGR